MNIRWRKLILALIAGFYFGCNGDGSGFVVLEEKKALSSDEVDIEKLESIQEDPTRPIVVDEVEPSESIVTMGNQKAIVFRVYLSPLSGALDSVAVQLNDQEPIVKEDPSHQLVYADLSEGLNVLTFILKNAVSKSEHTFKIQRDELPAAQISLPDLSQSNVLNCREDPLAISEEPEMQKFKVVFTDKEETELDFVWTMDGEVIPNEADEVNNKALSAQIELPLDCKNLGKKNLVLRAKDSHNELVTDVGFVVHDPANDLPDPLEIVSYSPQYDPYVINNATTETFTVTLKSGNIGSVTYRWYLNDQDVSIPPYTESFFRLDGSILSEGVHTLKVEAMNATNKDTVTFNVFKNTPPETSNPSPAGVAALDCPNDSLTLSVDASDVDSDDMIFQWRLGGAPNPQLLVNQYDEQLNSISERSRIDFTPSCTEQGAHTISVDIFDGSDTTTYTWSVVVSNPSIATVDYTSPVSNPLVILSGRDQDFSVIASGKAPLSYQWSLDGTDIPGATSPSYRINSGDLQAGSYALRVRVSDYDSSDNYTWTVVQNAPPVLSSITPDLDLKKINKDNIAIFTVDGSDANGDAITYTWTLDAITSPLLGTSVSGPTAQAVFSPNESALGAHVLRVVATDGYESVTHSWNVEVNLFSVYCNEMGPGDICTVAGRAGRGDGLPALDKRVLVRPRYVIPDGAGNFFFTDTSTYTVFFYNASDEPVTRVGITAGAGQVRIVLGNGAYRSDQVTGVNSLNFQGFYPHGIAYNSNTGALFVTDRNRYRVVRVNSAGLVEHVFGTNRNNNVDGDLATNHYCRGPSDLAIDEANDTVFVSCYNSRSLKYFTNASAADTSTILGYNGMTFVGSPIGIDMDSNGNIYISEYNTCRISVYARGANPGPEVGSTKCSTSGIGGEYANSDLGRWQNSYDVAVHEAGGNVLGYFISSSNRHLVFYANVTDSPVTIGGQEVGANSFQYVLGTGTADFNGDGNIGIGSHLYQPMGLLMSEDNSALIFADEINSHIRRLDLTSTDGKVSSFVGGGEWVRGFNGDTPRPGNEMIMNNPHYGEVINGKLYISELSNARIRKLDLTTGEIVNEVGEGSGNLNDGIPAVIRFRYPMGLTKVGQALIMLDNYRFNNNSENANTNCAIRAYNPTSTIMPNLFGTSVAANYVKTIGGNYSLGCQSWQNHSFDGAQALNVSFRGEDITYSGGKLYVTDFRNHCIYTVSSSGVSNLFLGTCGSAGTANNNEALASGLAKLRYPKGLAADADPDHPEYEAAGNFFFIDQHDRGTSLLKYVNQTENVIAFKSIDNSDVFIPAYSVGVVANLPERSNDVAVYGKFVCASSGYDDARYSTQSVYCFNREQGGQQLTIGTPLADTKAGVASAFEQEGIPASTAKLYNPHGLDFDEDGNLYIIERLGAKVRRVNKWW